MRASSPLFRRLLGVLLVLAGPSRAAAEVTPGTIIRDVWELLQQQVSGDSSRTEQSKPRPRVLEGDGPGAVTLDLDDVAHPISLEQHIREAVNRPDAELRIGVPGGQARLGDFSIGSDQIIKGHILVVRGDVTVTGRLDGNLVTWQGDVIVQPGAVITGDVLALGGEVRALGGEITGASRTLSAPLVTGVVATPLSTGTRVLRWLAGVAGVFLMLFLVGAGLVLFARGPLETVSDTVRHSFARAFVVGLLGQVLLLPTFGMLVVGLVLSVAGILLLPFVVVVGALLLLARGGGGAIAMAHAMGETLTRRQMARGAAISPNSFRYVALGLGSVALLWFVWAAFGWVPMAGPLMQGAAIIVSWLLGSIGFGAALLSRGGLREHFAGRVVPPEMLTDEYLWATPRFGVPAVRRPDKDATPRSGTPRFPDRDR
ncbi:MAG: hypothetical protein ACJ8B6_04725 [Gemmatimonadales bacterium]